MFRLPALFLLIFAAAAHAQYVTTLALDKKQYVAGEAVVATVTITNHSGVEQVFSTKERLPWLNFLVRTSGGNPVPPKGRNLFGPMKIAPGQTLSRQVDLVRCFMLSSSGNYSVSAVISPPGNVTATATNRAYFSQFSGTTLWSQKVGIAGGTKTREYRLLKFTGPQRNHLYVQVTDNSTGRFLATYPIGDMLSMRQPVSTVDQNQRMHTMFLASPTAWIHCCVDSDGRLVTRQLHYRAAVGDPRMVTTGNGTVQVVNSIPYDPKAAAKQQAEVRKASDRPPGEY